MKKVVSILLTVCIFMSCLCLTSFAADNDLKAVYYNGRTHTPKADVKLSTGEVLEEGTDYKLTYKDNLKAGTATVFVDGMGKYNDYHQTLHFEILPIPIEIEVKDQEYASQNPGYQYEYEIISGTILEGESLGEPEFRIVSTEQTRGKDTTEKIDTVTVEFPNPNYKAIVKEGKIKTTWPSEVMTDFTIYPITDRIYNGTEQTPVPTVLDIDDKILKADEDYTVSYKDNKNAGIATITVTGLGVYEECETEVTFKINKKDVTVTVDCQEITQGESYSAKWKISEDLCEGDSLPSPDIYLPDTKQAAGKYPIIATFPEDPNYNIIVKDGVLTVVPEGESTGDYTVTTSSSKGGTVSPEGVTIVKKGDSATFKVTPDSGYKIGYVYVDGKSVKPETSYTFGELTENKTIYVKFVKEGEKTPSAESTWDNQYNDVDTSKWFYGYIKYADINSLMDGIDEGSFEPDSPVSRSVLVTALYRLDGEPEVDGECKFEDVKEGDACYNAVVWATGEGIVNGIEDDKFGPEENVTREQLVTFLYRYAQSRGYDTSAVISLARYTDKDEINQYALRPFYWACAEGLITGVTETTLVPKGIATRAQVATVITRFCQNVRDANVPTTDNTNGFGVVA